MGSVAHPSHPPQFLVIGAGSRGCAYARAVTASTDAQIAAVADVDPFKRQDFGRKYIWGTGKPQPHQTFAHWQDWVDWEITRRKNDSDSQGEGYIPITGVFICTLDETHAPIIQALAPLNLHILCEKPLALSLHDCLAIQKSLSSYPKKVVSIGHVLRYSPHNILLRKLVLEDQAIGEIVSIEHTEPIGYWHFAHSYVRGNWRRSHEEGVGSLLTKSCHDIDFLMWLMCSPSRLTGDEAHEPNTITSSGNLSHFRKGRKPKAAGNTTNCLDCQLGDEGCVYSAKKIYRDRWLRQEKDTGWPLKIVVPEIEDIVASSGWEKAEETLMRKLGEDYDRSTARDEDISKRGWYGRCVYESDNDVCDEQTVTITWDEDPRPRDDDEVAGYGRGPKTALFHMTYPTQAQCERRGRIYGSLGEISYDSKTIHVHSFVTGKTTSHVIPKQRHEIEKSHGGGDWGLAGAFVNAVSAVEAGSMPVAEAQRTFVGCDLEEIVRSHAVVFAAEKARQEKEVVGWEEWWKTQRREFDLL
jgi:predicted dehydrogenase